MTRLAVEHTSRSAPVAGRRASFWSGSLQPFLVYLLVFCLLMLPPATYAQQPAGATPQTATPVPAQQPAPAPPPTQPMAPLPVVQNLKIIALAGAGEMNDLERHVMALLVVQVLDQNDRPVEGADVVFRFPLEGPSATFANQKTSQTVRTNGQGQAGAAGWNANDKVGAFKVNVTATYGNQMGETTVPMTNVTRIVEDVKRRKDKPWYATKKFKIAVIAGAAAGVALGVILATRDSKSTVTISPGSPTVGGPQ